ncbi:MAG: DUF4430 domain-containing protein [Clostridia bacterium]|nr:DUF4430 domain-containing protein [Clostridia bacterium]
MKKSMKTQIFSSLLVLILLFAATACLVTSCDKNDPQEGIKKFTVEVFFENGDVKTFQVESDKNTVGDALVEEGLISGEDGTYGWFITTVDGEYHKYEEDGKYWAFYINGEYASAGVSSTNLEDGATYAFKAES